ncbi:multicopper oxidase family protein [Solimicrobium silvestre]|uniref:multicopper oxidase family protein n=1 Tax=Solimicrobium silvestre TaxID=2099400 RepID=UPI001FAF4B3A|nr:multicopper oxidase domain-containing protein [Solimicrobium silvestre]
MDLCPRPQAGSAVPEPEDLRSQNGVLKLDLSIHNYRQQDGSTRYCYLLPDGTQSPTLRLHPGDLLILRLKNDLVPDKSATLDLQALGKQTVCSVKPKKQINACTSGAMTTISTNLHFHGLTVPPVCHQDDVLKTAIQPSDSAFEYRFKIPRNEPPGLYWYHPHIHGFSSKQVQGGASGALIIEGIERAIPDVAGLPERVLIIRDQDLLYPDAAPSKSEPVVPKMLMDRDGDAGNNGTGFGKPAKDLSINFVPVPYPEYPPASITMKPDERQLWRVLNASSITYLNLSLLFQHSPQQLGIIAIDGVPIKTDREHTTAIEWVNHIGLPPGARVEFIMNGPPVGVPGLFVTRTVDTGPSGENDTNRALATVLAKEEAATLQSTLPTSHDPLPPSAVAWLGDVTPTRVRKLYFSEKQADPSDPNSATEFYITEDGKTPTLFDPQAGMPNIVTTQGDVEDWIIENRSTELHAFHIHQIHFLVMDWSGIPIDEPFLRDTVNIPYFKDNMLTYPSVRLRMDFRDPNTIGTFVYHCHLLEHEDGGMMGTVRVERPTKKL